MKTTILPTKTSGKSKNLQINLADSKIHCTFAADFARNH